jgi:hypothetical protein
MHPIQGQDPCQLEETEMIKMKYKDWLKHAIMCLTSCCCAPINPTGTFG